MTDMNRRHVLTGIGLGGGAIIAGRTDAASAAPSRARLADIRKEADVACLYHCDYGDPLRFEQTLNTIGSHYAAYGDDPFAIQIAVVAHEGGVKFFLKDLAPTTWKNDKLPTDLFDRIRGLSKTGLKVYLCELTFERNKLDVSNVHDEAFISFVPSGVAAIGALQSTGFSYLKIG